MVFFVNNMFTQSNGFHVQQRASRRPLQVDHGYQGRMRIRVNVSHCDVQNTPSSIGVSDGGSITWGIGNIDADPFFADPANDDYHLQSQYGRWNPQASGDNGNWVIDGDTSPCINAGDPTSDYSNQPQPSRRIEIGDYGNTAEASKGKWILPGDANGDSTVDILDMILVRNRLGHDVSTGDNWKADVNEDGRINVLDLLYARNRLGTSRP